MLNDFSSHFRGKYDLHDTQLEQLNLKKIGNNLNEELV